ncbi:MAG: hypothetical protein P4L50_29540 [Anaerolineaceae bacterium]|nr:hypothetical protein [Anaerolineaceae bacterium]
MTKKILLICGSLNQTTIMHQISQHLPGYECYFTPFYADYFLGWMSQAGLLDFSILGGRHRMLTEDYLRKEHLPLDVAGKKRDYDLIVTATDIIVQQNLLGKRVILVQEGMTEPEDLSYQLVRHLKLPRFLANTAATGLSNAYDVFCVASPGYRDLFIKKGIRPNKMVVTGIPNFDYASQYLKNNFPHHNFVLAATSSTRETLKFDNRMLFLEKVRTIAAGRPVIFKLHPNENYPRAIDEINQVLPDALVLTDGNVHEMIANCAVLVAQRSSVIYTGIALGKEVHAELETPVLKKLLPVQNGGKSAYRIAQVCSQLVEMSSAELNNYRIKGQARAKWRFSDQTS